MPEIHDQTVVLPRVQLLTVFMTLGMVTFLSTLDSTCVSTAQPSIGAALSAGSSITWVGTSYNVASTVPQMLSGRLSDIFGRKLCLQVALVVFSVGNLLCGFARTATWLYVCRAVAGLGGGALASLGIIIIADVVSLRERGKYLSLIGVPAALGLGLGPEIGGALAQAAGWRWVFWITVPVSLACVAVIQLAVPLKSPPGAWREKARMVDWAGSALALAGAVCVLVPVSSAGSAFAWDSATSISLFTVGGVLVVAFVVAEHYAVLPVLPLHLFGIPTVALTLATMVLVGIVFICNMYVAPLYFQNALGYSPVVSGALLLPLVMLQTFAMIGTGALMKRFGRTRLWILIGYAIWTAGQGGQIAWGDSRDVGLVAGMFVLQGIGFGMTSQSTLVLAQACCARNDRAVVSSARAFFRQIGGSLGLAVCTALISSGFRAHLPADLPPAARAALLSSGFTTAIDVSAAQMQAVRQAYYFGLRGVFILFTPAIGLCFVLVCFMKDASLDGPSPSAPPAFVPTEPAEAAVAAKTRPPTPTAAHNTNDGIELLRVATSVSQRAPTPRVSLDRRLSRSRQQLEL
ncbi:hypothetical protein Q5752_002664 [Cryptotrichosporon argae]